MSEAIRVLHVFARMDRGGAETMLMNLYRAIDKDKVQFDFVVHTEDKCDYDDEIQKLGGRIYTIPRYKGINHFGYLKAWKDFFLEHDEHQIIHSHIRSTASLYLPMAKKSGLKTIIHSHNTSSGNGLRAVVKTVLQLPLRKISDMRFACSVLAGKWLFGNDFSSRDTDVVINNAIDATLFSFDMDIRKSKRKELDIVDKTVIGHIGRFHPQKNHPFLIDIFRDYHKANEDAVLLMIGIGDEYEKIRSQVESYGIDDVVKFLGLRTDIPQLLQAMDVFLFPSNYEGLPVTLIEAQASGVSCLISSNITDEVIITNNVKKLDIDKGTKSWVDELNKITSTGMRKDEKANIIKANYDIKVNASLLHGKYMQLLKL